ncbi:RNA polymerase sigma-70 factor (ECF subfamily) [Curtobacterium flaccumfaciens]|uniref:RNA polymerase sigma-70 factor (ECF subfamily) n=1 Tax=Curtobacterium salicis TaxID=1779862 RepID=A0ABX0TC88_9MICO|nr:sigma-70 family RNA polymerase sigma factor [Curtobacterium sp. WW7]NII41803.1 RNA polymerase sigma-70 factor (ECF subfamily) [Curtobacterium sp. WW7]
MTAQTPVPSGDAAIAAALIARDEAAFDGLYRRLAPGLRHFTRNIIRDADLAEDVTHDAFIELWERPERFDPTKATLQSWLRTIAHRRAIDRIRSRESARARDLRVGSREQEYVDAGTDAMDTKLIRPQLMSALAELSAKQRDAVVLRYLHEFTGTELADRLGINVGTARTRTRDGLMALQALLPPQAA